eukprot:306531_1
MNYEKWMKPVNIINRIIHGLRINTRDESQHDDVDALNKVMVFDLLNRVFCIFQSEPSLMEVPLYIDRLWNHSTFNTTITLNVIQLMNDYKWLSPLFMKTE